MLRDERSGGSSGPKRAEKRQIRILLIAHGIAWGFLLLLLAFVAPRIKATYADFGLDLPRPTVLVIRVSHQVVAVALLVQVLLGADWLMLNVRSERRKGRLYQAWSVLMLAAPLLLIILTLVAWVQPLGTVDWGLGG